VKNRQLTLTLVNPHATDTTTVEIAVRGGSLSTAQAVVLAAPEIHAHNTFDQPRLVQARPQPMDALRGEIVVHQLAPASVTRITMGLS
jgi:alpha-N-arabinofuranosidase